MSPLLLILTAYLLGVPLVMALALLTLHVREFLSHWLHDRRDPLERLWRIS